MHCFEGGVSYPAFFVYLCVLSAYRKKYLQNMPRCRIFVDL